MNPEKLLVVITGPTASGKTALSIELASLFRSEIISADSRQIFRELRIGTAQPSPEQLGEVPHHFIGSVSIHENYHAGLYEEQGIALIEKLFQKHDILFMAGGSGLYINAICKGFDPMPVADPSVREELNRLHSEQGIGALQEKLREADPDYYHTVDRENPRRLIRALEVAAITGRPYSSFRKNEKKKRLFRVLMMGIDISREELEKNIRERTRHMMNEGLAEEVKQLLPFRSLNALQTVGYREMTEYFDKKISLQEAEENICISTRQYAKRQMTWLKREKEIHWFGPGQAGEAAGLIRASMAL